MSFSDACTVSSPDASPACARPGSFVYLFVCLWSHVVCLLVCCGGVEAVSSVIATGQELRGVR